MVECATFGTHTRALSLPEQPALGSKWATRRAEHDFMINTKLCLPGARIHQEDEASTFVARVAQKFRPQPKATPANPLDLLGRLSPISASYCKWKSKAEAEAEAEAEVETMRTNTKLEWKCINNVKMKALRKLDFIRSSRRQWQRRRRRRQLDGNRLEPPAGRGLLELG